MFHLAVQHFARSLRNLDAVVAKAETYAKGRNFDVNNFMTARLAPDMLPFPVQIRIACDNAKALAANFAGKEAPKHEDTETTIAELRGRITKCLAYLDGLTAADFEKTKPDTLIKLPVRAGQPPKAMQAQDYLWQRQIPNFYFHVSTAYAVLRAGGVDIGKSDYLGVLTQVEL
jgi:uncharacterized protein